MGKFAYLVMVSELNNNKFYQLTEQTDGTISVEYGRVDSTKQTTSYPMYKWNSLIKSKIKKGYKDVTDLVAVEEKTEITSDGKEKTTFISDENEVRKLIEQLQSWANTTIQKNYKVSTSKVTQKMVDVAQDLIDKLSVKFKEGEDYKLLNKVILEIYTTIPRKMGDVKDYMLKNNNKEVIENFIDDEQKLLDTMAGQVLVNTATKNDENIITEDVKNTSLLDQLGLKISLVTDKSILNKIKNMMADSSNLMGEVFEVINIKTENRYIEKLDKTDTKYEELLWHGSRNQNWFNILQTGLLIRPSGAIYSGSMFGDGEYFANKAQKSIGYTSLRGSYWAGGSDNKSFLALFKVNLGNQKHVHRHSSECYGFNNINIKPHDSVYAHGGADLRNDEFIVYDISQSTIKYLVEIKR